jgi:flagellar hook-associated protein 1
MSDLLGSLRLAANSLEAQHRGLDVTGQNIANVNTVGFSRRTVDFAEVPPSDRFGAGRGVEATLIRANRDRLIDRRLREEIPNEQREAAIADALSVVEASLGRAGQSIDANLTKFFDAFSRLAENPQSSVARNEVLLEGESIASAFRTMSDRLTAATRDNDTKIRSAVEEINVLAGRIASINSTLGEARLNGSFEALVDEQDQLVRELAQLTDIALTERTEGGVDVTFGNGRALVIGVEDYAVGVTSTPPYGYAALTSNGATVTGEITGGRLGGLLEARDVLLPSYMTRLDTLAYETATQVNALHTAGFDQAGLAAGDFFAAPAAVAGAAAAMSVDPAVAADATRIAAASTAVAGDNDTARAIADLRDARVLDGNTATLHDYWGQLVYRVGRDTAAARQEQKTRGEIVNQVELLRDQVSGVSLDEEAMQMMRYQRAYEANARFFSAVSTTLDMLLQALSR